MEYCINCGEEIKDNAEICRHCGVNQSQVPDGNHEKRGENEKYCIECGELINKQAELCPNCGVRQQRTNRDGNSDSDQTTVGLLAILLGIFGAHKFYQGRTKLGVLYLCFSWTIIPGVLGVIEGILILVADEEEYAQKYADGDVLGK